MATTTTGPRSFRKSSYSAPNGNCVQIANTLDALRDSKNPSVVMELGAGTRTFINLVQADAIATPTR